MARNDIRKEGTKPEAKNNTLAIIVGSIDRFMSNARAVKLLFVALLVVFFIAVYSRADAEAVSRDDMQAALAAGSDLSSFRECDERDLKQFIGLEPSSYEYFIYYKGTEALSVDEILIVRVSDKMLLGDIRDAVDSRISSQTHAFESYGPQQVKELKNAVVITRGEYLFYCVADDPGEYEGVFKDVI